MIGVMSCDFAGARFGAELTTESDEDRYCW